MSRLDTCRSDTFRKQCSERMKLRHKLGLAPIFKSRRTIRTFIFRKMAYWLIRA